VGEQIEKLSSYLSGVAPDLELLRSQGKHLVLAKQVGKTRQLQEKTRLLKERVNETWAKSGSLVKASDLQITLKQA